jgi:general secretion pathway protein H
MPISATGSDRRREAGFTLTELMVVLAIIGLLASVVVLSTTGGQPSGAREAEQFAARLVRARDEALMTNRAVEVAVSPRGYAFRVGGPQGWTPLEEGPFQEATWSPDTRLSAGDQADRVEFDPAGVATPADFVITRGRLSSRVSVDTAGNVRVHDATAR